MDLEVVGRVTSGLVPLLPAQHREKQDRTFPSGVSYAMFQS